MIAFAAQVSWSGQVFVPGTPTDLLGSLNFHQFDHFATRSVPGGDVAIRVRAVCSDDNAESGIFVDQRRQWLVVGDVRVYDVAALRHELGLGSDRSSLELVARMYAEHGDAGLARIHGDFAFVIWDWRERVFHAIRDQFGLRSLFFRTTQGGMAIASDVRPLLGSGHTPEALNRDMVLDYLLGDLAHHGLTFFQSIHQVWPGHRLEGRASGIRQTRYWHPPPRTIRQLTYHDMILEWRRLFERSVTCRLESSYPIGCYLSGGIDSGAIVGASHSAYSSSPTGRPPMFTLSALFPGLSCDETQIIEEAVAERPIFRALFWDGCQANGVDFTSPHVVMPGLREGIGRGPRHELQLIEDHGLRVLLSGFAGDELGWSHGYFRDLVSRGRLRTLVQEMRAMDSWQRGFHHLRAGFDWLGAPRGRTKAPAWISAHLRERFRYRTSDRFVGDGEFDSVSQQESWSLATLPQASFITDASRLVISDGGAELRLPYRDLKLVEFVLQIPWELRSPQGDLRRVQRSAIDTFLTSSVKKRRSKVLAGVAVAHQLRANFDKLRNLITGRDWTTEEFVDQANARAKLARLERFDPRIRRPRDWLPLWKIAVLEAWNRARLNYHVSGRTMMRKDKGSWSCDDADGEATVAKELYEPPTLVPIGNARSLLALVTGLSADMDPEAQGQTN